MIAEHILYFNSNYIIYKYKLYWHNQMKAEQNKIASYNDEIFPQD
jgi:hypothetical protein